MWLFQYDVFVQWFGFWQFMGVCYALLFSMILVGTIINRKNEEAFYEVCRIQREIDEAAKQHPCLEVRGGLCSADADITECPFDNCPLVPF